MSGQRILIIDFEAKRQQELRTVLEFLEYEVVLRNFSNYSDLLSDLGSFSKVLIGAGGEKLARVVNSLKAQVETIPILFVADQGTIPQIPTALEESIHSVQCWPTTYSELTETLKQLKAGKQQGRRRSVELFRSLGGNSQAIQKTRTLIQQVADTEAIVLILGESGTGKEVVARNLHYYSARRDQAFVPVNCGAIPSELLESELFGHEKGAFTGALNTRQGRFELAQGGTLFLDEIGDMPLAMQVKLLRVLQEKTFERVGSNKTINCDVRIIAATHRNLEEEISENRFREDLFYRLNVFPIEVPALRERAEDIPVLVEDLIARIEHQNRASISLSPDVLHVLKQCDWPGNVRELANLIERLAILNPTGSVDINQLPEKYQKHSASSRNTAEQRDAFQTEAVPGGNSGHAGQNLPRDGIDLREHLTRLELDLIRQALDECEGVVAHAAKLLKMRRTTLVEKMRKYNIQRNDDVTTI